MQEHCGRSLAQTLYLVFPPYILPPCWKVCKYLRIEEIMSESFSGDTNWIENGIIEFV